MGRIRRTGSVVCRHCRFGSQASNSSHQHAKPFAHLLIEQATYEEFIEIMREEARYVVRQLLRQSLSAARGTVLRFCRVHAGAHADHGHDSRWRRVRAQTARCILQDAQRERSREGRGTGRRTRSRGGVANPSASLETREYTRASALLH